MTMNCRRKMIRFRNLNEAVKRTVSVLLSDQRRALSDFKRVFSSSAFAVGGHAGFSSAESADMLTFINQRQSVATHGQFLWDMVVSTTAHKSMSLRGNLF